MTFTGEGLSATTADYKILIDGFECSVSSASTSEVKCTTAPRPGLHNSTLLINIAGKGRVSLNGKMFKYASAWSAESTWGGEFEPMDDEMVYVPSGFNLLVDIDVSPKLKFVVVEGGLIFLPHPIDTNHKRTFDSMYIFVTGGFMEVGTEEYPYTSKITFTMHGDVKDPYLPIYGNKVLGVRFGTLDMHGPPRNPTWTSLDLTANAGENQITLMEACDW